MRPHISIPPGMCICPTCAEERAELEAWERESQEAIDQIESTLRDLAVTIGPITFRPNVFSFDPACHHYQPLPANAEPAR